MGALEISEHPSYNLKYVIGLKYTIGLKDIITLCHYFHLALQNVCKIVERFKSGYLRDITNLSLANSRTWDVTTE